MEELLKTPYKNQPKFEIETMIETNDIKKIYNVERV